MTVRVYRSTDASAPVLTGQVGSLTALLDAVLVNGLWLTDRSRLDDQPDDDEQARL
jgi:hypothetical protein